MTQSQNPLILIRKTLILLSHPLSGKFFIISSFNASPSTINAFTTSQPVSWSLHPNYYVLHQHLLQQSLPKLHETPFVSTWSKSLSLHHLANISISPVSPIYEPLELQYQHQRT